MTMWGKGKDSESPLEAAGASFPSLPVEPPSRLIRLQHELNKLIVESQLLEGKIMRLQSDLLWLERHPEANSVLDRLVAFDRAPREPQ
jgi:hypothetical protein